MKKLPLDVQRNYTIKNGDGKWDLKCIVCDQAHEVKKPTKGGDIDPLKLVSLIQHASSHPLPQAEEEAESLIQPMSVLGTLLKEEIVSAPADEPEEAPPPSQVTFNVAHCIPTAKNPNAYKVEFAKGSTKVSNFRDESYNKYRQVQKEGDKYSVVLYAANPKHASLVGERLIQRYKSAKKDK